MNRIERSVTLDEILQLEAFITLKQQLLSEVNTIEVRELLVGQIKGLCKQKQELTDQLRLTAANPHR